MIVLSYAVFMFLALLKSSETNLQECTVRNILNAQCLWMFLPKVILAMGVFIVHLSILEFVIAQSPWEIQGLMLCIVLGCFGLYSLASFGLDALLTGYPITVYPGPSFYYYVVYLLIALGGLLAYLFVSRRYRLRKRDDIVPIHKIAEDYFEKNYKREQRYWQAYDDAYGSYSA